MAIEQASEVVTISWETIMTIVVPVVGGALAGVKWIISRSDRDREALLSRMDMDRASADEDRRTLRESLHALKNAVQAATLATEGHEATVNQMVQSQQRIVWTQERILALLEAGHRREEEARA
jgi:hypothetical protein